MLSFVVLSLEDANLTYMDTQRKSFLLEGSNGITASVSDTAAVNPKCTETRLANGLSTFFIKGNPVLKMDQENWEILLLN